MTTALPDRSDLNADPRLPHLVALEEGEAPARRQPGQATDLWLEGTDEPVRVRITNRERIHYERTAAKHKWPKAADAQNLAMTFVCWSAAKRAGLTTSTFEQFEELLLDYDVIADEPADPTR